MTRRVLSRVKKFKNSVTCDGCGKRVEELRSLILVDDNRYCHDCGISKAAGYLDSNKDKEVVVLVTTPRGNRMVATNDVDDIRGFIGLDKNWLPRVEFNCGAWELWFTHGVSGDAGYQVFRAGPMIKGVDYLSEFKREIKIEDLRSFDDGRKETKSFIVTPMCDANGWPHFNKIEAKETGEVLYIPFGETLSKYLEDEQ